MSSIHDSNKENLWNILKFKVQSNLLNIIQNVWKFQNTLINILATSTYVYWIIN
jgi:hypothetical protein